MPPEMITIIMPVLDEAALLAESLGRLRPSSSEERVEIIVVDGGSSDGSVEIAGGFADRVLSAGRGRGRQMRLGAEQAEGEILLFLHADCSLPEGAFRMIRDALGRPGVSMGAFDISIGHGSPCFRLVERGANLRSRITRVPYGDQGVFMLRSTYHEAGGFSDLPIMEDVELASRLKRLGKTVFLRPPVLVNPRRWLSEGPVFTTLRDWSLAISYSALGASPERLARHYRVVR